MTRARRWLDDLTGALGVDTPALDTPPLDDESALAVLADLEQRHGEPQRHYHTIEHVDAVLRALDDLIAAEPLGPSDPPATGPATALAAWFHDAIYDPTSSGNEAASAALASTQLVALGLETSVVAEIARLIAMTAGHVVKPGDRAAALLADADLSILGAPADVYDRYAEQIRLEYHHVPIDAYRVGRADILARFLERNRLFHTRAGRARWERAARTNLERERMSLLGPTS